MSRTKGLTPSEFVCRSAARLDQLSKMQAPHGSITHEVGMLINSLLMAFPQLANDGRSMADIARDYRHEVDSRFMEVIKRDKKA